MIPLTAGAIDQINGGIVVPEPVMKIIGHKNVPGSTPGQNRYRLLLSDGEKTHSFAMLATQLNHLIEDNELVNDTVVRVKKYVCNNVQKDKYVIILLDLEILGVEKSSSNLQSREPYRPIESNTAASAVKNTVMSTPPKASPCSFTPSTPGTPSSTTGRVFPINSLNPYQSRWTVKARVSQKATIRTWNKNGREGKLFSFILLDDSGEIKVTAFNQEVDKYYDLIEANRVYYISKGTLKPANKQFNTTKNDYEMTLNSDTTIVPCEDDNESCVPQTQFNFVPIAKLDSHEPGDYVDIVGVAHETGEVSTIVAKTSQRELQKRELGLVDTSGCLVRLTLWGEDATQFDGSTHPVVVIKSAKLHDFNGRSLSVGGQSSLMISPTNVPEALRLKGWYDHEGFAMNFETYRSEMMGGSSVGDGGGPRDWNLLADLNAPGTGTNPKADWYTVKAIVTFIKKENFMYKACATEACKKKVIDLENGLYRCEKCAREAPSYKWCLLLSVKLSDMSGEQWITCFQNTGEVLLGKSTEDLGAIKETQDENQLEALFMAATFQAWVFRLRAKIDHYNDDSRLRVVAVEAKPLNEADYARQLQKQIDALIPTLPAELSSVA